MGLVDSLLTAIVQADGDALVLHVGEKPYVVAPSGQSELSARVLTFEAMSGMLTELLPTESQRALDEYGAVQHELVSSAASPDERFTLVAARGGEDIWIEVRRRRKELEPPAALEPPAVIEAVAEYPAAAPDPPELREILQEIPEIPEVPEIPEINIQLLEEDAGDADDQIPTFELINDDPPGVDVELLQADELLLEAEQLLQVEPAPPPPRPVAVVQTPAAATPRRTESHPAVVLPLARTGVGADQATRLSNPSRTAGIERLLRIAAARGASTLYLTSQSRPSIRVDGQISAIEGEPVLSEPEVEGLMLGIIPERNREALRSSAGAEWICDVPDVGRVRCVNFRDHRGAGGIFRMIPARAISADQLGLSREIQGLCAEAEGLVLVTGPRASGKSTLISAFVDLINRSRSDHAITLESEIKFVHESRGSLISQREVRGDDHELVAAARAALRENPDVLVIEDLRSPEILSVALEAAQSGHLVIGALTAHTTTAAIDRIIDQTPPERRPKVQLALAEALRGIVAQVLLRKTGSGRVAAREVLLNTSAVANLIAEGKTSQLPMAIESGRKHGMVPLNDALAAFVASGIVDSREAYRNASDQAGFLSLLKRQGIDTTFVERLA